LKPGASPGVFEYFPVVRVIGNLAPSACDDIYVNDQLAEFAAEMRRYCTLVENEDGAGPHAFQKECLPCFCGCIGTFCCSPALIPTNELPEEIPYEEWQAVRARTAKRTDHDQYWEVFESFPENKSDPICGSTSDDLADIWRDVKMGLFNFR
jgi:hypothetical protein